MAIYTTGRTRTIHYSGDITGREKASINGFPSPSSSFASAEFDIRLGGTLATIAMTVVTLDIATFGDFRPRRAEFALTASVLIPGFSIVSSSTNVYHTWAMNGPVLDANMIGEWAIDIDTEEIVTITEAADFPTYGGTKAQSEVMETTAFFAERLRLDGQIVVSCSLLGMSVTLPVTITAGKEVILNNRALYAECRLASGDSAGSVGVTTEFDGDLFGAEGATWSNSHGTASCTGGPAITSSGVGNEIVVAGSTCEPPVKVRLKGRVNRWNEVAGDAYVFSVDKTSADMAATVNAGGGEFSEEITQRVFSASATIQGQAFSVAPVNELQPIRGWLKQSGLTAKGDDLRGWRSLHRAWRYQPFTVSQSSGTVVDDCASLTPANGAWTNIANMTLAASGGQVRAGAAGLGQFARQFGTAASFAGYRYLQISGSANGTVDLVVDITTTPGVSKKWNVQMVPSLGTTVLDLCCPDDGTATTDSMTNRHPTPTVDGPMWGVTNVGSITFGTVPNLGTVWIEELKLVRQRTATSACLVPAFEEWAANGASDYNRVMTGDTDGRQSLEEWGIIRTGTVYSHRTIQNLVDDINSTTGGVTRNPGWTGSAFAFDAALPPGTLPISDQYLNLERPAVIMMGGGLLHRAGVWEPGIDINVTG